MPKRMTSDQLMRFAILKSRRMRANLELPEEKRLTREQIEDYTRDDIKNGRVNQHGFVVEAPWDSTQPQK